MLRHVSQVQCSCMLRTSRLLASHGVISCIKQTCMFNMHIVFQAEALLTQPQISKPVLLIMPQQGSSPWHPSPLKWETVSKWLGCRHQGECNLHSQIAPSVSRTATEIYTQAWQATASIAQQLIRCNRVGCKVGCGFWRVFEGRVPQEK